MINAKKELVEFLETNNTYPIMCAKIERWVNDELVKTVSLKKNYTKKDFKKFLAQLNFNYSDYKDFLEGYIWFSEDVWAERYYCKYDEKTYWQIVRKPQIPNDICK